MISTSLAISLLTTHFIADFLFQTDWMALNKSKNWRALLWHTLVYSYCFLWCGLAFAIATLILHIITDAVTSRITSKLWFIDLKPRIGVTCRDPFTMLASLKPTRHWFFVVIGLDQLIHGITLVLTWRLLNG